jgi:hypothetical protein
MLVDNGDRLTDPVDGFGVEMTPHREADDLVCQALGCGQLRGIQILVSGLAMYRG